MSAELTYPLFGATQIRRLPIEGVCGAEGLFCQYTEQRDTINFQFKVNGLIEAMDEPEMNTIPSAAQGWTGLNWWKDSFGSDLGYRHTAGSTGSLTNQNAVVNLTTYRFEIEVLDMTTGTLTLRTGTTDHVVITAASTFSIVGIADTTVLELVPSFDFDGMVNYCRALAVGVNQTIVLNDGDDNLAYTFTGTDITRIGDIVSIEKTWSVMALADGCYYVMVTNNDPILDDQEFVEDWVLVGNVTIVAGDLDFIAVGAEVGTATLSDFIIGGVEYQITIDIDSVDPGMAVNLTMGTSASVSYSTAGAKLFNLTASTPDAGRFVDLAFNFSSIGAGTMEIGYITITKVDPDGVSFCYNLATTHGCTKLFTWSNDESWGLFDYTGGFEHSLRHPVNEKSPKFPTDRRFTLGTNGTNTQDYAALRKARVLGISKAPEYIMNAFSAFFVHDTSEIEGVEVVTEEDLEPVGSITDMTTAQIEIQNKLQPNQTNLNC